MRAGNVRIATRGLVLLAVGLLLVACASARSAAPPTNAPAGTRLARIQIGMNDTEVRDILGNPDDSDSYMTGKAFLPSYYFWGADTHRSEWMYRRQGRVIFARSARSGAMKVIRVVYDPNQ